MTEDTEVQTSIDEMENDELKNAMAVLRKHRYIALCSDYLTGKMKEDAVIKDQLHILKRRRRLTQGYPVDESKGRAGRPITIEREVARSYSIGGTPFVMALYIAKGLREQFNEMTYSGAKKLKRAFDSEYRRNGVEPPAAPHGWWHYSLETVDQAGWPEDWESRWIPDITCELCQQVVTGVYRRALMKGHVGIEWYPIHSECAEEMASQGLVTPMEEVFAR